MTARTELRPHNRLLGFALRLSAVILVVAMAAVVKWLGLGVPVGEVMFVRGGTAMLILLVVAWRMQKLSTLSLAKCYAYAPRTIFSALSLFTWFASLTRAPLAIANAIGYTLPIFATLFALFSGERVRLLQWGAVAAGFVGVLIMVGPHVTIADASLIGMLLALASAMTGALVRIFLRQLSSVEDTIALSFYFSVPMTLAAAFTAGGWVIPTPREWFAFGLIGLIGTAVQLLSNAAYRHAEVAALAPLEYVGLVVAVLSGYWLFNETPELSFWVGLPLLLLPGLLTSGVELATRKMSRGRPLCPQTK